MAILSLIFNTPLVRCEDQAGANVVHPGTVAKHVAVYGEPTIVAFVYKDGVKMEVLAVAGQVTVFFDNRSIDANKAKELIEAKGGAIVSSTPSLRYLVKVPVGEEGRFISAIMSDARVTFASPNAVSSSY